MAAMLALVEAFNGGTHEVACSYTHNQLHALMVRAEGLVDSSWRSRPKHDVDE